MLKGAPLTFIIRATGERTIDSLKNQLIKQIRPQDFLEILDEKTNFEAKLEQSYSLALNFATEFTVLIDADILIRTNTVSRIIKISKKLNEKDMGFGLLLWDRFYNFPKYRGLHIYRTELINEALKLIPKQGTQIRPESFIKKEMTKRGYRWRNDISRQIVGLHDYYQYPEDIYYKFLIRSKRSIGDIDRLSVYFKSKKNEIDFKMAYKGLMDGKMMNEVLNDKELYIHKNSYTEMRLPDVKAWQVDLLIFNKLFFHNKWMRKLHTLR